MKKKGLNKVLLTLLILFTSCTEPYFKKLKIEINSTNIVDPINENPNNLTFNLDNKNLSIGEFISFSLSSSFLSASNGSQTQKYRMGTFKLKDDKKFFCSNQTLDNIIRRSNDSLVLKGKVYGDQCLASYKLSFKLIHKNQLNWKLTFEENGENIKLNRTFFKFNKEEKEKLYGLGEQFSHLQLNGLKIPLLTEEQGIGRGDFPITWGAEIMAGAGGHEFSTYAPIPFLLSHSTKPKGYFFENKSFSVMDLTAEDEIKFEVREKDLSGTIWKGENLFQILEQYTLKTGRFPNLPEWAYGTWLGMQGGREKVLKEVRLAKKEGNPITALWIQDWVGKRQTYFGSRLFWNWESDKKSYPDFKKFCDKLWREGVAVLGYINPYLADNGNLYNIAKKKGYFVKNQKGKDYRIETPGFDAFIIDLTNPKAYEWLKEVIKNNLIEQGLRGWMADFGEWLPMDSVLFSGISAELYHNDYPVIWAKLNREAIKEAGMEGKIVFFTRSGFSYSNKYSTLFWEGDQMVSFDRHDGLPSTIVGLLSSGLSGISLNHSDVGGYTTINNPIIKYYRSEELFLRWAELNAFTPIFRTHEGNRPTKNHQPYSSIETRKKFARYGKMHFALKNYLKFYVNEAAQKGLPVVRPLFLHYPQDKKTFDLKKQFLLGEDILVLPVLESRQILVKGYLPKGKWRHLFLNKVYYGSKTIEIKAPLGTPAVFIREDSVWKKELLTKFLQL
tara:strand:- start:7481 stop:9661 length:2181 start_codon:yes stop_codon:yes gene_type:complete